MKPRVYDFCAWKIVLVGVGRNVPSVHGADHLYAGRSGTEAAPASSAEKIYPFGFFHYNASLLRLRPLAARDNVARLLNEGQARGHRLNNPLPAKIWRISHLVLPKA